VERALIFAGDRPIAFEDLPMALRGATRAASGPGEPADLKSASRDFERRHIIKMLTRFDNNKATAAKALGIGLSSLYRKMEELNIAKDLKGMSVHE
jgi:transcriptional regulator with PAS, ATPase and Fis domain